MGAGRIVSVVLASIVGLFGIGLIIAGASLLAIGGGDGYLTSDRGAVRTPAAAVVSQPIEAELDDVPSWVRDRLGTLRIRAERAGGGPAPFIGIGPTDRVRAYLEGVPAAEVSDVTFDPFVVTTGPPRPVEGRVPPPPATRGFWAATATGEGERTLEWDIEDGDWTLVLMNADGTPGVAARGDVSLSLPILGTIGAWMLGVGIAIDLIAVTVVMVAVIRRRRRPPGGGTQAPDAPDAPEAPDVVSRF